MYFQGNTEYVFESSIDDTAYLKIGDEVVHNITTYTKYAKSTWTSGEAGWYPIDLRVGDYSGGHGPINNCVGFQFSTDNKSTWTKLLDSGNQSMFCLDVATGVTIDSVVNTGIALRLGLSFDDIITDASLTACYGASYGAENLSAWTTLELDPIAAGETFRSLEIAIPEDTEYFRIMYAKDGTTRWTETLCLADYPAINPATPTISFDEILATTESTAEVSANIIHTGTGFDACDIEVRYGTSPTALNKTAGRTAQPLGVSVISLSGLTPNRTYYVQLRAYNTEATSEWTETFTFQTQDLVSKNDTPEKESLIGLWQARVDGTQNDWTTDILELAYGTAATDRRRALGAQMAYCRKSRTNDFEPTVTDSWTNNSTWVYRGYIYLEAGEYTFRSCLDDSAYLKLNDEVVHDFPTYTAWATSSWTCPETDWYELDLRVGNGSSNAGPMSSVKLEEGFQFSNDGGTTWQQFLDPGDGSFLRTEDPLREISVSSFTTTGGTLSAELNFSSSELTYSLYIAYGETLGGNTPSDWENTVLVAEIAPDTNSYSYTGLEDTGTNIKFARFYLLDADGDFRWSDPLYLPDPTEIAVSPDVWVDTHLGDALVVSGSLVSAGNNEKVSVSVLVSTSEDLADPITWVVGEFAAGETFIANIHESNTEDPSYITPGQDYYIAILATAADGSEDRSDILQVTPLAGSSLSETISADSDMWTITIEGELESFGAGEETIVELWIGTSEDVLSYVDEITLTEAGPFSFTTSFDSIQTIYYQLRALNNCSTEIWEDESAVQMLVMQDNATYYWKPSVSNGAWSDPANWENSLNDSRLTFPNSSAAAADFTRCTDSTITVILDGDYTVASFLTSAKNLNLTLQGSGVDTSRLYSGSTMALAQDETILLDNAYLHIYNATFSTRSTIRTTNGAYLYSHTEWSIATTDPLIEILEDSQIHIQNFLLRLNGTRPVLRINNGTLTQGGTLAPNSNAKATGVVVEFAGTHPYLAPGAIMPSEQNDSPTEDDEYPLFNFIIPEEGYEDGPRINLSGAQFPRIGRLPTRFEVDAASPWFLGGKTKAFKIMSAKSILTDYVDFSDQPRATATRFYYTYGADDSTESDGNAPTGLWVEVTGMGATILILR